eukprot:scaffold35533_cov65-Cyclotella_meneghiniana.AAC.1
MIQTIAPTLGKAYTLGGENVEKWCGGWRGRMRKRDSASATIAGLIHSALIELVRKPTVIGQFIIDGSGSGDNHSFQMFA